MLVIFLHWFLQPDFGTKMIWARSHTLGGGGKLFYRVCSGFFGFLSLTLAQCAFGNGRTAVHLRWHGSRGAHGNAETVDGQSVAQIVDDDPDKVAVEN